MALTKEKKVQLVDEFAAALDSAQAVTFVQFSGLSVGQSTDLRSQLYDDGVSYRVTKKTLLKRALDASSVEGTMPALEGNIAMAWSADDATAPARGVHTFAQEAKDNMTIVGGIFEGRYMDAAEMQEIATIPSVDVLRGMFLNVINSPIQGLVIALNQIAEGKE